MQSSDMACSDIAMVSSILMLTYMLFSAIVAATSPTKILPRKSLISSSSLPFHENLKLDGRRNGFSAPLIHPNNPESPFYDPNATPEEVHEASVRSSRARGDYFHMIMSSGRNFSDSRKYPSANISLTDGTIVMRFSIGDPSFQTYALLDTGSALTWVQCLPCTDCYKQTPPFYDPYMSPASVKVDCRDKSCEAAFEGNPLNCAAPSYDCAYYYKYEDGASTNGEIWQDTLIFDDATSLTSQYYYMENAFIGCGHDNPLNPGAQTPFPPGVVGLSNATGSLIRQLGWPRFSFCITSDAATSSDHKSRIFFGPAAQLAPQVITQLAYNPPNGWYIFNNVKGIWVGENQVKGYPEGVLQYAEGGLGGLFVDTGTTYAILNDLLVDAIVKEIKDNVKLTPENDKSGVNWSLCYNTDALIPVQIPEINIRFSDTDHHFPYRRDNFWIYNYAGQHCLAILKAKGISIIGMYQLRDVRVGIDVSHNLITFTETFEC